MLLCWLVLLLSQGISYWDAIAMIASRLGCIINSYHTNENITIKLFIRILTHNIITKRLVIENTSVKWKAKLIELVITSFVVKIFVWLYYFVIGSIVHSSLKARLTKHNIVHKKKRENEKVMTISKGFKMLCVHSVKNHCWHQREFFSCYIFSSTVNYSWNSTQHIKSTRLNFW